MKRCILIAITLCIFSCSDEDFNSSDNTVHLAGFLSAPVGGSSGSIGVASYWKDGIYTGLTHDSIYSQVNSLYVDGSSVLIGGWKLGSASKAVIWQDGKETIIEGGSPSTTLVASRNNNFFGVWHEYSRRWVFTKNGVSQPMVDTVLNFGPTGLALLGDDMYISGASVRHGGKPDSKTFQNAQCWKNGQLIFRESENSNALSIFIYQNDIYMAGHLYDNGTPNAIACYWKNGQRVPLTDGNSPVLAKSIFVTDTHVYVAGMMNGQAVYWKDGEPIVLTTEGTFSMANSIFVKGTDVHVAGYERGYPAYWKNDVKQNISNQERLGQISFVVVGSN